LIFVSFDFQVHTSGSCLSIIPTAGSTVFLSNFEIKSNEALCSFILDQAKSLLLAKNINSTLICASYNPYLEQIQRDINSWLLTNLYINPLLLTLVSHVIQRSRAGRATYIKHLIEARYRSFVCLFKILINIALIYYNGNNNWATSCPNWSTQLYTNKQVLEFCARRRSSHNIDVISAGYNYYCISNVCSNMLFEHIRTYVRRFTQVIESFTQITGYIVYIPHCCEWQMMLKKPLADNIWCGWPN
jgi:hypothetical protein